MVAVSAPARGHLEPDGSHRDVSRRVVGAGAVVAAVLVAIQTCSQALSHFVFHGEVGQLNVEAEPTIWSWASSTATGCTAFVIGVLLLVSREERRSEFPMLLLPVVVAFFSADDALQVHERLPHEVFGLQEGLRVLWPTLYLPLFALVLVLLPRLTLTHLGTRAVRAGVLMLVGAVACELASAALIEVGESQGTLLYDLEVAVEEGLELAGWILVLAALTAVLLDGASRRTRETARSRELRLVDTFERREGENHGVPQRVSPATHKAHRVD